MRIYVFLDLKMVRTGRWIDGNGNLTDSGPSVRRVGVHTLGSFGDSSRTSNHKSPTTRIQSGFSDGLGNYDLTYSGRSEGEIARGHRKVNNCCRETRFPSCLASVIGAVASCIFVAFFHNGTISNLHCALGIVGFSLSLIILLVCLGVILLNLYRSVMYAIYQKEVKPLCPNGADQGLIVMAERH
ncbi:MAG: hypothetical protein RSB82_03015 [Victivallaceae bacterium]